jgi:hypothetical protein
MNNHELINSITQNFTVQNVKIPVSFMYYEAHNQPYIVWMQQDQDQSYSGDDELLGMVEYYDFDVYSKGNYLTIIEKLKALLKENGFKYQPSRSSADLYETDTGYYHKTLNFAILRQESEEIISG